MLRSSALIALLLTVTPAQADVPEAGDAAAGQARFEAECAECHRAAALTGERGSKFIAASEAIAAGKARHRPRINLTPKAAADVKAFLQKTD